MATVTAFIRTSIKKIDKANVRFRLRDGRNMQLFYKSELEINPDFWDTKKQEIKAKVLYKAEERAIFNKAVNERKDLIIEIYNNQSDKSILTSEWLNKEVDKVLNPEKYGIIEKPESMCEVFQQYVDRWLNTGVIGEGRKKHYDVVIRELQRFFIINGIDGCSIEKFTKDEILNFREFLRIEYTLVDKYPGLYIQMNKRNKPSKERGQNTIAEKLLLLQAFMTDLESSDVITVSPFRKIGKEKEAIMKQQYDEPICLTKKEFTKILNKDCSDTLKRVRDIFIVQCCFGCRIGDFRCLSFDNISVESNIPYIHYLPQKTIKKGDVRKEIKTPIIRIAYDIITKYQDEMKRTLLLPYYPEGNGETGYNQQIKELLKFCEINRKVAVFNTETGKNEYMPIYDVGSSKLARKTFVDIMNKVQIDKYAAGLHSHNSSSVERYTNIGIKEQFVLMCAAFGCELYKVNENLDII